MHIAVTDERHWSFLDSSGQLMAIAFSLAVLVAPQTAIAQSGGRSGKEVVNVVCSVCHASGAKGAPKIGDEEAWAPLASRGLSSLTESALNGIRNMPSHGGSPGLTDSEIERAIIYMVNHSGGNWVEPISSAGPPGERTGQQIVEAQCARCHETGVFGAPKIGDRTAWVERLKQGIDYAVRSAINGHGPMPPRGGMADLTDDELRSAILYMFNPVSTAAEPASTPQIAARDPNRKFVDGMEVYLGVVSAETMRNRYAMNDPERMIHGGIPSGEDYNHLNISLFDSKTRLAIADAKVEASVIDPVSGVETKELELINLYGTKSYGNYFHMSGDHPFRIAVRIRRPGMPKEIRTEFQYKPY